MISFSPYICAALGTALTLSLTIPVPLETSGLSTATYKSVAEESSIFPLAEIAPDNSLPPMESHSSPSKAIAFLGGTWTQVSAISAAKELSEPTSLTERADTSANTEANRVEYQETDTEVPPVSPSEEVVNPTSEVAPEVIPEVVPEVIPEVVNPTSELAPEVVTPLRDVTTEIPKAIADNYKNVEKYYGPSVGVGSAVGRDLGSNGEEQTWYNGFLINTTSFKEGTEIVKMLDRIIYEHFMYLQSISE